jgi:hypothetical protein
MQTKYLYVLVFSIPLAALLSFVALIGRADSPEDVSTGKFFDWVLLGPLWAVSAYITVRYVARNHRWGNIFALLIGIATWIAVAWGANWWEDWKVQLR